MIGSCKEKAAGGGCGAGQGAGGGAEGHQTQVGLQALTHTGEKLNNKPSYLSPPNINVILKSFTPSLMASRWSVELGGWQLEDDAVVQAFLPPTLD